MSKTYRYDPDEYGSGRRNFSKAKKQAKKQVKFEKRRADRREFDTEDETIEA